VTGHDLLVVLVPQPGTAAAHFIRRGSGVVARPGVDREVRVDYEGNLYGAAELVTFEARVRHAAGRLREQYPTVARGTFPRHTFTVVGTLDGDSLLITDRATVSAWCDTTRREW